MRAHTITPVLFAALLFASTGSQSLAQLSGSDDFNDNSRDPSKWFVEAPHLNETNARLEFTNSGTGDELGIWVWTPNSGSYTQNWSVTVDAFNSSTPAGANQVGAIGLFVVNGADHRDLFGIALASSTEIGRGVFGGWETDEIEYWESWAPVAIYSVKLRVSYDASAQELSCAFDSGGGFVTLTNFNVSSWVMSTEDTFPITITGLSENSFTVSPGQIYVDNFQAVTQPAFDLGYPPLNGSDDFNDNMRDTSKWLDVQPLLTETNNRLEFTTSGVGDEKGGWAWIKNTGSHTQDWAITVDAFNSSSTSNQWSLTGLFVVKASNGEDWLFATGITTESDEGRHVMAAWNDGSDHFNLHATTQPAAKLRISYDSVTKELTGACDVGDGFITLTNRNMEGVIDPDDSFLIALGCSTEESLLIHSGEMYFDNFEAVTLPGISNHLISVSIDYTYKAGSPDYSGDEYYKFGFEAETDSTVANVYVQCPGGYSFNSALDEIGAGKKYWATSEHSTPPFFSQFGDGKYIVTITYSNGINQSTIIPYAQADGVTPMPSITELPTFSAPSPLHGTTKSCTNPITLVWTDVDSNANGIEIEYSNETTDEWTGHYYTDTVNHPCLSYFSITGPLSTRSADPKYLCPGDCQVEVEVNYDVFESNSDGVLYGISKRTESQYNFTVVDDFPDVDGDGISNCWEIRYFGDPTNAIASLDSDLDGHNNLQESITGMDPTNAASVFMITNSMPLADDFLIEWPSVEGRVYNVNWSTNLTTDFHPMGDDIDYPQNSYTDTLHGAEDECFYRVDVRME